MSSLKSKIQIGYDLAKKLLDTSSIKYKENEIKKINFDKNNFSNEFLEVSQTSDYKKTYDCTRKNYDYDILLDDDALLQFSFQEDASNMIRSIRYAFYESPIIVKSYEEFLKEIGLEYLACGDMFFEDYEQYKSELELKPFITTVRYDYNIDEYDPPKHATSHIHIGYDNEVRIPMSVIITPLEFVAFILRHIYFRKWKLDMKNDDFYNLYKTIKNYSLLVTSDYFSDSEKLDLYIGR